MRGLCGNALATILAIALIASFTNDALGRLIAKQSPWPSVPGEIRTEIYLHDGVRRIQERWREPDQGNGSEGGQNQNNGPPAHTEFTAREYVHSPGYVDEFVCEIDTDGPAGPSGAFWWVLQDPNYNVVALVSDGDGSLSRGEAARQYSWSPYGQLLRADIYDTSAPMSRLGHQGLFHDRLDADILTEPMVAFSDQLVQNRNRTLSPRLGRFLQRDPNGTGTSVIEQLSMLGAVSPPQGGIPDGEQMFGDGGSLFLYTGARPTVERDPTGLFFGAAGVAVSGGSMAMSIDGTFNEMLNGIGIMIQLSTMISGYAAAQEHDVEWAGDWDAPDDGYFASGTGGAGAWEWLCAGEEGGAAEAGGGHGHSMAGAVAGPSRLRNITRPRYIKLRKEWNSMRRQVWKDEARANRKGWSQAQLNRMERGLAPRGWVVHHRKPLSQGGTNDPSNLVMMRASDHRRYFRGLHSDPPTVALPRSRSRPAIWD